MRPRFCGANPGGSNTAVFCLKEPAWQNLWALLLRTKPHTPVHKYHHEQLLAVLLLAEFCMEVEQDRIM